MKLYCLLLCRTVENAILLPKSLPFVGKSFALLPIWDLVSTLHSQQTLAFPQRVVIYQTKGHLFKSRTFFPHFREIFVVYMLVCFRLPSVVPVSTLTLV